MVAAAAAETRQSLRTVSALVRRVTTLGAPRRLTTSGAAVSEPLAFVAPEGLGTNTRTSLRSQPMTSFSGSEVESKVRTRRGVSRR